MKEVIKLLFSKDSILSSDTRNMCRSKCVVSVILCISALFMLIINIRNHSTVMTYSSIVLVAGFLSSAVAAGIFKKDKLSSIIIALLVAFVLSVFALSGGNEGFAILWILLVPLFAINLLGVSSGLLVSTYFLIFIPVLFYSGLNGFIADKYTDAFISRFPILYVSDYMISTYFSMQREYYQRKLKLQAYTDGLTGAYNRSYFIHQLDVLDTENKSDYSIVEIDLNGLKSTNDSLGHEAGDEIIKAVVECCKHSFDKEDTICRIGGDEYAVIAYGDRVSVEKKLEKLEKHRKKWNGKLVDVLSFAAGYAYKEEGISASELMKIADKEMYNNKVQYYNDRRNDRRKRD